MNTQPSQYGVVGEGISWSTYLASSLLLSLNNFFNVCSFSANLRQLLVHLFGVIYWQCLSAPHAVNCVSGLCRYFAFIGRKLNVIIREVANG